MCFSVNFAKFLRTPFLQNTTSDCFWSLIESFSGIAEKIDKRVY